ncbi:MAG: lysine--tRNA ligase [Verrucomicrobiales bacterium]
MSDQESQPAAAPEKSEHELIRVRREKIAALRERGIDPYGAAFAVTHTPGDLRDAFADGIACQVAGRLTAKRDMGKSQFFNIGDISGTIQCWLNPKSVGDEDFDVFKNLLDMGDWIGVEGETFTTQKGEPTIKVTKLTVLSKALRPLPDKWHGLADRETKYRQRYLDLISNEQSRQTFVLRSKVVAEIRRFLQDRGFLEVETPMLQSIAGGAAARPFETFHNALGIPLYMRIAPELYLKRLLVGGFSKVFELNRNFRNEGISRRHNPEFTMLEAYWAGANFSLMAELVEEMICHCAEKFCGSLQLPQRDEEGEVVRTLDLSRPWKRRPYRELVDEAAPGWFDLTPEGRRARCAELGVEISPEMEDYEVTQQVFEKLVEEKTFDPCYVTHVPKELVPLAKQNADDDSLVDVYELIINGQEISPGYSELNDPSVQRQRLEAQVGEEIQNLDEDFLLALEHGMPPAGGIGVGIDRLLILLSGESSIRDVVLFPQLKPKVG